MLKETSSTTSSPANKRKKIWELSSHHHCSIVGTCLTIGEARALGKKIGATCPNPEDLDATIHSILVRESVTKNRASTLLNKTLNKKYESSLRIFNKCNTPLEITKLWKDAFQVGNIPGPYWAALSHPLIDNETTVKIYSDVHMLSHLVGSSNRADIARLSELEIELANALDKNRSLVMQSNRKINRFRNEIENHQRTIRNLERENSKFKARLSVDRQSQSIVEINEEFSHGVLLAGENYSALIAEREHDKSNISAHNLRLLDDIEKLNGEKQDLRSKLRRAHHQLKESLAELQSANSFINSFIVKSDAPTKRCNLSGKCVLYIGGRAGNICRMCNLVDKMNGRLIHHDGGKEDSLATLKGAISSADAVIFPTDCVSHSSALEAKKLCKKMIKPLLPIRSSSLSSLLDGLTKIDFENSSQNDFQRKD
jgi:hypothetical protein